MPCVPERRIPGRGPWSAAHLIAFPYIRHAVRPRTETVLANLADNTGHPGQRPKKAGLLSQRRSMGTPRRRRCARTSGTSARGAMRARDPGPAWRPPDRCHPSTCRSPAQRPHAQQSPGMLIEIVPNCLPKATPQKHFEDVFEIRHGERETPRARCELAATCCKPLTSSTLPGCKVDDAAHRDFHSRRTIPGVETPGNK